MKRLLPFTVLIFIMLACKKPEERTCWKGNGDEATKIIDLNHIDFKGFELHDDMNFILIPDSSNYMEISSYKNRVDHFNYYTADSLLVIEDKSKCDFLRNFDKKTQIAIHYKNISVLNIKGNGNVSTSSPISNNILHIYSHSANGDLNIEVNANSLVVKLINGTLTGLIKGQAESANLFHFGYSKINFESLEVEHLRVSNKSDSDVFVKSNNTLVAELLSLGKIYYKGTPTTAIISNTMGSQLIDNN